MPYGDSGAFDLIRLLDALEGVDYVVVGGVAATLHGSPRLTVDLDIVPDPDARNIERLAGALRSLQARLREPGQRGVSEQLLRESATASAGGQLRLRTRHGPIDVLWRLHDGRGFADLDPLSVTLRDNERSLRVLDIEPLIEVKRSAGRRQDVVDIENLEAVLERRRGQS